MRTLLCQSILNGSFFRFECINILSSLLFCATKEQQASLWMRTAFNNDGKRLSRCANERLRVAANMIDTSTALVPRHRTGVAI